MRPLVFCFLVLGCAGCSAEVGPALSSGRYSLTLIPRQDLALDPRLELERDGTFEGHPRDQACLRCTGTASAAELDRMTAALNAADVLNREDDPGGCIDCGIVNVGVISVTGERNHFVDGGHGEGIDEVISIAGDWMDAANAAGACAPTGPGTYADEERASCP